jgi:(p)ppGpp synthase/HD superfamily hydrolase
VSDESRLPDPVLGDRFRDAVAYATELHARQARKGTATPYLTHLLTVCALVLEDVGTEDEAIAALLHDGPEDQGGHAVLDEIRRRFGGEVATMVDGLSDTLAEPKPAWHPRKKAYLERLPGEPASVLRISLADKLHNLRSVATDELDIGDELWGRFNAGRDDQAWYYRALLEVFEERLPESRNMPEFRRLVEDVFGQRRS